MDDYIIWFLGAVAIVYGFVALYARRQWQRDECPHQDPSNLGRH